MMNAVLYILAFLDSCNILPIRLNNETAAQKQEWRDNTVPLKRARHAFLINFN